MKCTLTIRVKFRVMSLMHFFKNFSRSFLSFTFFFQQSSWLYSFALLSSLPFTLIPSLMHFLINLSLPRSFSHYLQQFRARVLVPMDLGTIASETKMSFYGTDHALFAKVITPFLQMLFYEPRSANTSFTIVISSILFF